ncbi:MAG: sodium:solute symporter family protein [bacterium]
MKISGIDWFIIFFYFAFALGIGLYFSRRAGKNITEYMVAGRSLPWWLAGTSMVATTFAADTPLAVTELVYKYGVAGNWLWWNFVFSGILTVFFFARLWRRVGVLTDVEFTEIRYGGKPAAFLRGFRALYLGIIVNAVIMGWVISAMGTIIEVALGIDRWIAIVVCLIITVAYSSLSGLWGVVITDFFQFALAMTGSILLAIFGIKAIGGIDALKARMLVQAGSQKAVNSFLSFTPKVGSQWMPVILFLSYIGVQWWASWYPGAEPGGGGYVAQRMFSAKDEKHSLLATLWFNIAHYGLRPWPWIITAIIAWVVFPGLKNPGEGYVMMMVTYLPPGILGLMFAAMAAAFMSTISTQLNWGCSYLVNDFYMRFLVPNASESHYVAISRIITVILMVLGGIVGLIMQRITGGWELLLSIGAGTGLVLILRWFWWRINAWSEISSMIVALIVSLGITILQKLGTISFPENAAFAYTLIITVILTTAAWITVTLLTRPESESVLEGFYKRARPAGPGWRPIKERLGDSVKITDDLFFSFFDWIAGCVLIYAVLFGIGKILLKDFKSGILIVLIGVFAGIFIYWDLSRRGWKSISD